MAKKMYIGVNGVARKVKTPYIGVDSKARKVKAGYIGVNGVARKFYEGSAPLSELPVGSSVYLNVNGTRTEFLVVHNGLPSSMYDSSCNGTWLMMKNIYTKLAWDSSDNNYQYSDIHAYLNGTFLSMFDSNIKSVIKSVRIPCMNNTGNTGSVITGSNGFPTKIFLLSGYEVGWTTSNDSSFPVDGVCLDYFKNMSTTDTKRIGYYNGTATHWWLRSPSTRSANIIWYVTNKGGYSDNGYYDVWGVRPAFVLPSETLVADGEIIT